MTQTAKPSTTTLPSKLSRLKNAFKQGALLRTLAGDSFRMVKRRLKPLLVAAGKAALRRSWVKRLVLAVLNLSPDLKNRLYRLVWKDVSLAPRAMRIYTALSTAIPTHSKGVD